MRVVCKILDQYPKSHKTQKRKNQSRHSTRSYLFLSNVIMSIRGLGPPCSVPVYLFGDRTCSPSTVRSQQTSNGSCGNCFKGSWQWVELIWLGGGGRDRGEFYQCVGRADHIASSTSDAAPTSTYCNGVFAGVSGVFCICVMLGFRGQTSSSVKTVRGVCLGGGTKSKEDRYRQHQSQWADTDRNAVVGHRAILQESKREW